MSEGPGTGPEAPEGGRRACPQCGRAPAPGAAFCRSCGARYEQPAPEQPAPAAPHLTQVAPTAAAEGTRGRRRPSGALIFLAAAIVIAAAGIAAAFLLGSGGTTSTETVTSTAARVGASESGTSPGAPVPSAAGSIEPGRYVQAGSFKFAGDAAKERQRLAAAGVEVEVVPSEDAQQLYPGFEVLLGGPLRSGSEEAQLLKRLHRNGVPSAFARPLTPAPPHGRLGDGTWTGKLEESSSSRPRLDRTLPVTFVTSEGGKQGTLVFLNINCVAEVRAEPSSGPILRFGRSAGCFSGSWQMRAAGNRLMLAYLPLDSDVIVLGELHPA